MGLDLISCMLIRCPAAMILDLIPTLIPMTLPNSLGP